MSTLPLRVYSTSCYLIKYVQYNCQRAITTKFIHFVDRKKSFKMTSDFCSKSQCTGTFENLKFDNLVLRSLPIDSNQENYPRTVSGACFSRVPLSPLENPIMVAWSSSVAKLLNLSSSEMESLKAAEFLSGSKLIAGSEPSAHCYCGHQFGYFAGQLGDGAAMYLGEIVNSENERWEIQLKGSGLTPYSRTADGRKVLRSSIREFLCSEAMFHLGIPTTRALSCVKSDTEIVRDIFYDGHPIMEKCTVVCRVAQSFLRFGSFEIFKTLEPLTGRVGPSVGRIDILKQMLEYVISTFYGEIYDAFKDNSETMYREFYREVVKRTAHLVAQWQCVGFCHGVLNTDNMSILGVTIDYGPFGFMDNFNPDFICNASDDGGRYSYVNQPKICEWNLFKLAEALQPVLPLTTSQDILKETFSSEFNGCYLTIMRKKLGLLTGDAANDSDLITDFLQTLKTTGADFTNSFRVLSEIQLPGSTRFHQSVEETKQKLIEYSCSASDLKFMHKPGMEDSHFKMYITLLSQHPEILSQLGKGVDALKREIERREKFEEIINLTDDEKKSQDEMHWTIWLNKYTDRLKLEVNNESAEDMATKRISIMNSTNPKFILRNYIAQVAIEKAEQGDFSEVNNLLRIFENPYSDDAFNELEEQKLLLTMENLVVKNETTTTEHPHPISCYNATPPTWAKTLRVT